jgi:thymidylate kinase
MIVVLEGHDGCGKSSVGKYIANALNAEFVEFPNDNGLTGPMIRDYLKQRWEIKSLDATPAPERGKVALDAQRSALAFQALQIANRWETFPTLDQSKDWVFVRYWQSGWVYGGMDGIDSDWLLKVHEGMPQGDVNILLDTTIETSMKRREARDGATPPERYEGKRDFGAKVWDRYRALWDMQGREGRGRWHTVNAENPFKEVINEVCDILDIPGAGGFD